MAGEKVTIVEVGPRDGLQNEKRIVSTGDKLVLIELLARAGFRRIEATAFVSPKWVPQMADHDAVMRGIPPRPGLTLSALVPNEQGARAAIEAGAQELAVFASASETFARKNTNCTISESMQRFKPVLALARTHGLSVRGYVSCAVECPYEDAIQPSAARWVSEQLLDLGCAEIAVADTIGRATPDRVDAMLAEVLTSVPVAQLACHFHDTSGQALANVDVALGRGVRIFDSAIGGLGGCPYAPGAAGNVASERLVRHIEKAGFRTDVDSAAMDLAVDVTISFRSA
ncbi:hydroxymethylglutaryl-CoA lyase [Mesorhizobium sp. ASY16-5R]|uniref:hydroxymethylglutaryl-CoA lyase n=1 Tax=Mesorhizobium sp. ASY16-5R TaxID=3445772 RepID=UPI003FA00D95